jgi:hypothetical protein
MLYDESNPSSREVDKDPGAGVTKRNESMALLEQLQKPESRKAAKMGRE